jgi:hypothetical protein
MLERNIEPEVYLRPGWFSPLKYVKIRSKYFTYLFKKEKKKS